MDEGMRLFALAGSFCIVAATVSIACSSSAPTAAATPDAGSKAAPKTSGDDDDQTSSSSNTTKATSTNDGGSDGGLMDAAATGTGTLEMTGDGGVDCDDQSFREQEPNNDEASANQLVVAIGDTKFCGVVQKGDPDFITFKTPEGSHCAGVVFERGNPKLSGSIGGQAFTGFDFPSFQDGDVWILKVDTGLTSNPYRLRITFGTDPGGCQ